MWAPWTGTRWRISWRVGCSWNCMSRSRKTGAITPLSLGNPAMKAVDSESAMIRQGATVAEIQRIDKIAIEKIGIPSVVLMENAGRAVAREVQRVLKGKRRPRACVVCGLGNNAGDGFVAARYLRSVGTGTKIFLIGEGRQLKDDAA